MRNVRLYGPGGWKARAAAVRLCHERAASGEPCAICGQLIDVTLPQWYVDPRDGKRKRAPWSCECDEIIPVSLGGSPTSRDNTRPVHRICNQKRGNGTRSESSTTPPPVPHDVASGEGASRW